MTVRFSEVLSRFDILKADIDGKPVPPTIWQIAGSLLLESAL